MLFLSCNEKKSDCIIVKEWHQYPIEDLSFLRSVKMDSISCDSIEQYSDVFKKHPNLKKDTFLNYINDNKQISYFSIDGYIEKKLGGEDQTIIRSKINIENHHQRILFLSSSFGVVGKLEKNQLYLVDRIIYPEQRTVILSKSLMEAIKDTNLTPLPPKFPFK